MKLTLVTVAFMSCVAFVSAQTLTPNTFSMGDNSVGVPKYFATTLHNTDPAPQWLVGAICNGEGDVAVEFLRADDSSSFVAKFLLPDDSVHLLFRITSSSSSGLINIGCGIQFNDSTGQPSMAAAFGVGGSPSKSGTVTAVQPTADFGSIGEGTGSTATIVLRNTGGGEARYRVLNRPSAPFFLVDDEIWSVGPSDSIVVRIAFQPTSSGVYVDTITFGHAFINTLSPILVELRGSMTTSVEETFAALAPHPNPTEGNVVWCGSPATTWRIVNAFGDVVGLVSSDDVGNCRWTFDQSGVYFIQNTRTKQAMSVLVLH